MLSFYHLKNQLCSTNTPSLIPNRHEAVLYGRVLDTGAAVIWNNLLNNIKTNVHHHYIYLNKLLKTFLF